MGRHIPRTTTDELADARTDLAAARRALVDLRSHLDHIIANPDGAQGKARAAKHNADIIAASLESAGRAVRAAEQSQLTTVS